MKKSVFVILLSVFTSVLLLGCEKNQNSPTEKIQSDLEWDSLNWVTDSAFGCFLDHYGDANFTLIVQSEIANYFHEIFLNNNFTYPVPDTLSDQEIRMYRIISNSISDYYLGSDSLSDFLNSLQHSNLYLNLSYEEKVRTSLFAHTIIGISKAVACISEQMESNLKQAPRQSYNNRNGDSRFERQISSCFSYQLDGHFETIMGSIAYMAQLPASAVWDTLICAEEIATGLWDHVS